MNLYPTLDYVEIEIRIALKGLDTSTQACEGCGGKRYTNWEQHQAAEALQGALSRVAKARKILNAEGS